ncbi:transposase domain protein, partial [Bordetella holmesii 04P3421]
MKKRFTEEQIIGVLKEADAGAKPAELCRKHGISEEHTSELEGEV